MKSIYLANAKDTIIQRWAKVFRHQRENLLPDRPPGRTAGNCLTSINERFKFYYVVQKRDFGTKKKNFDANLMICMKIFFDPCPFLFLRHNHLPCCLCLCRPVFFSINTNLKKFAGQLTFHDPNFVIFNEFDRVCKNVSKNQGTFP